MRGYGGGQLRLVCEVVAMATNLSEIDMTDEMMMYMDYKVKFP